MEKGLEWATGEAALGSKLRSQQQAVPPRSSLGQQPGPSHRDYPAAPRQARLTSRAFPLSSCFLLQFSPAFSQPQSFGLSDGSRTPQSHILDPRLQAPQQLANTTPGIFHREQTHRNGGWRDEISDTPTTAAKWVAVSQFAREVFKNAENSPSTEYPALSTQASTFPKPALEPS